MMDHMAGLGAFMQAAETRSFVAAGRQLGVSASAIGKAVARLEDRLGSSIAARAASR